MPSAVACRFSGMLQQNPIQEDAIRELICGRDVLVTVPTGYGKSLICELLPFCASAILQSVGNAAPMTTPTTPTVLVASPLIALMHDQVQRLRQVTAATPVILSEDSQKQEGGSSCWTHVFASPEALLSSRKGRQLLLSEELKQNLVALVIDEAHCIVKW